MSHVTAALRRCIAAGAPLGYLHDTTWSMRTAPDGTVHPLQCHRAQEEAWPVVDVPFEDLIAAEPVTHAGRYSPDCHPADAITGPAKTRLRELDARARSLLEVHDWIDRGQIPFAVTSRARQRQNTLLGRFPNKMPLTDEEEAWLADYTAATDDALDRALEALPGDTRAARLAAMLTLLARSVAAAGPCDRSEWNKRNPVGVVAREAVAVVIAGTEVDEKTIAIRLHGRGARASYAGPAFAAAHTAVTDTLHRWADPSAPKSSADTGRAGRHLAAFVLGSNLDIPKDGLAGLAAAACWFAAETVATWGAGPRSAARGFLTVPPGLAAAAAQIVELERSTAGERRFDASVAFDVIDLGAWADTGDLRGNALLETTLRLWSGVGPMSNARVAYDAAHAVVA